MNSPCETCAFGKSGGAADEVNNRLKGAICAFGAIPFFCHHGKDGTEYDWQNSKLGPMLLAPGNRKMCAGWRARVAELKRRGYFPDPDFTAIRRAVAKKAFRMLETFTAKDVEADEKKAAHVELKACLAFIAAKDIGDKGIPL